MRKTPDIVTRIATVVLALVVYTPIHAQVVVVRVDGDNGSPEPVGNGSDWGPDAFKFLQDAITFAELFSEVQIWVAATVPTNPYRPDRSATAPNGSGDRDASFQLMDNVEIYGGFSGNEGSLDERDPDVNPTFLSGDLLGDDGPDFANNAENSINILFAQSVDLTAVLDGVTIQGGNADDLPGGIAQGAALRCAGTGGSDPRIRNCIFNANFAWVGGAAVYCEEGLALFNNCTFAGNVSGIDASGGKGGAVSCASAATAFVGCKFEGNEGIVGGAIFALGVGSLDFVVTNCKFASNVASGWGGAIYAKNFWVSGSSAHIAISNSVFSGNRANGPFGDAEDRRGGAIYLRDASFNITNCTIIDNEAALGGGIAIFNLDVVPFVTKVRNTVLFGNVASGLRGGTPGHQLWVGGVNPPGLLSLDYCDVEGGLADLGGPDDPPQTSYYGAHNIVLDPMFEGAPSNLRLAAGSPCLNMGDPDLSVIPLDEHDIDEDGDEFEPTPDLDRTDRVVDGTVDIGAYECNGVSTCPGDIDGNGATDVLDLLILLGQWELPPPHTADIAPDCGDGAVNVVDLLLLLGAWGPCPPPSSAPDPPSIQDVVEDAGLDWPEDWDEFMGVMTDDPPSTQAEKDNYACWMEHYLDCHPNWFCLECACQICPDVDPYGNH